MTEGIRVRKMSGAGNDFVVLRGADADALGPDLGDWIRGVCRRGLSVGADGVLAVDPIGPDRARVRYWNADGSEAFCGNGTRCAARFARLEGWVGDAMTLDTRVGEVAAEVGDAIVRIVLPPPDDLGERSVAAGGETHRGRFVVAGVPHFVRFVDAIDRAPIERWGPALRRHPDFGPDGANIDLVAGGDDAFDVRTWERGVEGETLACGTGAIATAVAVFRATGRSDLRIRPRSGVPLAVRLEVVGNALGPVALAGDARVVLTGTVGAESIAGF